MDGRIRIETGRLESPTRLDLRSARLGLRVGEVEISGAADLRIAVGPAAGTDGSVSTMSLTLERLRFRHQDRVAEAVDSGDLHLSAVAADPVFPDGFKDVAVDLRLGPLHLPDARVLNEFLPGSVDVGFLRGSVGLSVEYVREGGREGKGRLRLGGDGLAFRIGERECTGLLEVTAAFRATTNRMLILEPSRVALTNVTMSGVRNTSPEGWFANIEVQRGAIELGGPTNLSAEVRLELRDTRPLIALLRDDESSPAWLRLLPNLKDLQGGATVKIDANEMSIRDLRLRGTSAELLAQLAIRSAAARGIFYARYGLVSALFDFREGKSAWTIFGAKSAYRRRLAEMELDAAEVPEGDDAGDGESAPAR